MSSGWSATVAGRSARAAVGRSGAYTVALRAPGQGDHLAAARRPRHRCPPDHRAAWCRRAWVITAVTAPQVTAPSRIAVSGTVSPRSSGVVWLQAFSAGSWHDLGTAKLTAASTYLVHTTAPPGTYTLRVRKSAGTTVAAGFSPASTVHVAGASPPVAPEPPAAAGNVVRAWGDDTDGELGNGTPRRPRHHARGGRRTQRRHGHRGRRGQRLRPPVRRHRLGVGRQPASGNGTRVVPGLNDVTAISAYGDTLLALRADGTVWTWRSGATASAPAARSLDSLASRRRRGAGRQLCPCGRRHRVGVGRQRRGPARRRHDDRPAEPRAGDRSHRRDPHCRRRQVTRSRCGATARSGPGAATPTAAWATATTRARTRPAGPGPSAVAGATAIAGGSSGGYAVVAGGAVMAWGNDSAGQLGTGGDGLFNPTPTAMVGRVRRDSRLPRRD